MSIHLSMNLLRTMLAATGGPTLTPATDEEVRRVREAGAPKDLLEMYRIGDPDDAYVEMNGVRLFSIDTAIARNAEPAIAATLGRAGYFAFAEAASGAVYALDATTQVIGPRDVIRFDDTAAGFEAGRAIAASGLDAFVFALATNAIPAE